MSDVFISYRREGGEAWAAHIKELLEKRHVSVFLDKHKKKTDDFKDLLEKKIDESPNFLLILSKGVLKIRDEEVDWVREEIKKAVKLHKNLILVAFNGFNVKEVDWKNEPDEIQGLETHEMLLFSDANKNLEDASVQSIVDYMVDASGKAWKYTFIDNANWYGNEVSELDTLWMSTNNEVCRKMDAQLIKKALELPVFEGRDEINYLSFICYDAETLKDKIDKALSKCDVEKEVNVYGLDHNFDNELASNLFGEGHFTCDYGDKMMEAVANLLKANKLRYFDIIESTLTLKDFDNPDKILKSLIRYLNPKGGVIIIRDLDDDYVDAYPDKEGMVAKMNELLSLDPGAGNRHYGKRIYTALGLSGADEIYMSNEIVSSGNMKDKNKTKLCDAYFSYLIPEFEALVKAHPDNDDYVDALNWLHNNYDDVLKMFATKEFYIRLGFVGGFGVYINEDDEEDEE